MVVISRFFSGFRSQPAGLLDLLYSLWSSLRYRSLLLLQDVTSVPDAEFTPHGGRQFLSTLQNLFWAMDFQSYLYFTKIARELLAAAATTLLSAEAFMRKLSGLSSSSHFYFRCSVGWRTSLCSSWSHSLQVGNDPSILGFLQTHLIYLSVYPEMPPSLLSFFPTIIQPKETEHQPSSQVAINV